MELPPGPVTTSRWDVGALDTDQTEATPSHPPPPPMGLGCPGTLMSLVVAAKHPTLGKKSSDHVF